MLVSLSLHAISQPGLQLLCLLLHLLHLLQAGLQKCMVLL